ncbi:MAG: tetratricopeptide repeat protein [Phycisphaerae bacterium]|jgi:tetratricopeptide (TPR) repeat protein|nr:tetratricopeptide repeat protein [Phycisphaerae bacterium]
MRTNATLRTFASIATAAVLLTGCGGPTKAGQEARAAAQDRMHRATSVIVFDQARQSFECGQFDKAMKEVDEAIYRTPNDARYWVLRGRISLERGRLEQALNDFGRAIEVKADCADAYYFQGIVHERWSQSEKSVAAYRKAAESDPTKVSYVLAAAEVLVTMERYDEAQQELEPKLAYFENNAPMHQLLGQVAMLREEPTIAAQHFNRALLIDPTLPMVLDNLSRAQYESEQWSACLDTVRRMQRELPGGRTMELMRTEGRCLAMLGRTSDARIVFSEITRDHAEDAEGWIDLAAVAWELDDLSRVQTCGQRLLRVAPHRYEGYVFLGLVEERNGNEPLAREWFQKASKVAQESGQEPELLMSLAGDS